MTPKQIDAIVAEARGMKLVPIEPTPEMVKACYAWFDGFLSVGGPRSTVYRAMLAASPTLITDLFAVVDQLRAENARMREALVRISRETAEDHIGDTWITPAAMVARAALTDKEAING